MENFLPADALSTILAMKVFVKKETPVQNLAFCAIIAGFDGILSLIGALLPLSAFFLMMLAPLLAAMVGYFCKKRYYAVYLFGAMGVSLAVSAWSFENTLFYMLPSLCSGTLYGFLLRCKVNAPGVNFLVAMVQYSFFWISLLLIKAIYEIDMREMVCSLFSLKVTDLVYDSFALFALAYSFAVTGFSHLFFALQASRLGIAYAEDDKIVDYYPIFTLIFSFLTILLMLLYKKLGYFFLGCSFYWGFASFLSRFPKPHWSLYLGLGLCTFSAIICTALAFTNATVYDAMLSLVAFPIALMVASLLDVILGKKKNSN